MIVQITPIGIQSLQWKFYIIWTIFNFAFVPVVYFLYPETSDRTLEDVDRFFRENHDVSSNFNSSFCLMHLLKLSPP